MHPVITITAYGTPAPKGSKRHVGRGILVESSTRAKPWAEAVKHAALAAAGVACHCENLAHASGPLSGPVGVEITFTVRKPVGAPKRRTTWPVTRASGDVDKLARCTLDAIVDAGVMRDDSQIVELTARKVYPEEGIDALRVPGAVIRVFGLGAAGAEGDAA